MDLLPWTAIWRTWVVAREIGYETLWSCLDKLCFIVLNILGLQTKFVVPKCCEIVKMATISNLATPSLAGTLRVRDSNPAWEIFSIFWLFRLFSFRVSLGKTYLALVITAQSTTSLMSKEMSMSPTKLKHSIWRDKWKKWKKKINYGPI